MASEFHYEFEYSEVPSSEDLDSRGNNVTTVRCHGRLTAETRSRLEEMFKETPFRGRIILDLADVDYVDSAGLGALIRLKLSAVKQGGVSVKFNNLSPRVMQLVNIASLTEWFSN